MLVLATPQVECLPASTRSQPRWRARVRAQTCAKRVARDPVSHFRWMHAGAGRAGREQAPHARGVRQDDRDAGVGSRQVEGALSGRALVFSLLAGDWHRSLSNEHMHPSRHVQDTTEQSFYRCRWAPFCSNRSRPGLVQPTRSWPRRYVGTIAESAHRPRALLLPHHGDGDCMSRTLSHADLRAWRWCCGALLA